MKGLFFFFTKKEEFRVRVLSTHVFSLKILAKTYRFENRVLNFERLLLGTEYYFRSQST